MWKRFTHDIAASEQITGKTRDADGLQQAQNVNQTEQLNNLYDSITAKPNIESERQHHPHQRTLRRPGRKR